MENDNREQLERSCAKTIGIILLILIGTAILIVAGFLIVQALFYG